MQRKRQQKRTIVCTESPRRRLKAVTVTAFAHFPLEQGGSNVVFITQ